MYFNKEISQVTEHFQTDLQRGLEDQEVPQRRQKYGWNKLEEAKKKSLLTLFLSQLNDPLIFILLIAAAVSGFMGEWSDTAIIGIVVILNAAIGVYQEAKAEKSMEALQKLASPKAYVIRSGVQTEVASEEIVPGDLVVLDAGRYIPCDLRLTESAGLQIEESALTGESVPVNKNADLLYTEENMPLGDKKNMAFSSTLVTNGRGLGIAVATGMDTEIGHIAGMLKTPDEKTPLQKKLADIGKLLGIVALLVCLCIFGIGLIQKRDLFEMFLMAISLAVAAIPEGMPAIVSIVLAIGVQRMVKKNAIVRKLPSVETLGAVNVICSDKTGTLTQNKMTVMKYFTNGKLQNAGDLDIEDPQHQLLLENLILCNDATATSRGGTGDPTEVALLDAGEIYGLTREELGQRYPRTSELPFDSDRKLMTTIHRRENQYYVMTKGAADNLLNCCSAILLDGKAVPLTESLAEEVMDAANQMSDQALRVLGAAYKALDREEPAAESSEQDLTFIGLTAMIDPPRLEVKDSINLCRSSGIKTVMITGDHQKTALAIARELGIASSIEETISGLELDSLSDEQLQEKTASVRVFARVSPEHKVRIVNAFKASGNIVSMTGDGVNDAPSLKAADIGVAMGITGTDVAKGAADIVLTDDNFSTIVAAVEEGRGIYANIRKGILFLLSCNIGEIAALFLATLLGWAVPLQSIHLLWVNLITDSFPALSLGMDPIDDDIMKDKPRSAREGFFHKRVAFLTFNGILIGLITLAAFALGAMRYSGSFSMAALNAANLNGAALVHAQTMAFMVLSISQLFHAFNLRHEKKSILQTGLFKNKLLVGSVILGILLQLLVQNLPPLARVFDLVPLGAADWIVIFLLSLVPVLANEIQKYISRTISK